MTLEAFDRVYPKMKRDFPRAELKPRQSIRSQMKSGISTGWLLLVDGQVGGYAIVLADPSISVVLLDYLAVDRRGQGDGSAFLALLQQEYPQGVIVEAEDEVPGDSDEENEVRRRRMSFYQRAGFRPCSFDAKIFGVHYVVHLWLPESEFAKLKTSDANALAAGALEAFYRLQAPNALFRRFVHVNPSDSHVPDVNPSDSHPSDSAGATDDPAI